MKLIQFVDYEAYVNAQRKTLTRRGMGPYFNDIQIRKNCDWMRGFLGRDPVSGVCHGARNGLECDEFKKSFPECMVFGTDLFPFSGRSAVHRGVSDVIEWDFSNLNPDWTGKFNFVYSNSLDHAKDPAATVQLWLSQLKSDGCLLLDWSNADSNAGGGDNFGASLWEWVQLGNMLGRTMELIYSRVEWKPGNILRYRCLESATVCVAADKNRRYPYN